MFKRSIKTRFFLFHPHSYGIATLMRIGFRLAGWQLLLHHFRPHTETEFHDHPWDFRTWVLWGSYTDESPCWRCQGDGMLYLKRAPEDVRADPAGRQPRRVCPTCQGEGVIVDRLRPGSTRFRRATHAHRTRCEGHVLTVVLTRPKSRTWCKGTPGRWVCDGEVEDFDATRGMVKIGERTAARR